ncbi:MAG TPA: diacylglycerol kinase family protein, partial [Anaerolineales bacterium]|nr:diacylglycerol kinase family protein [Anaerolineales bacterium]
ESVISDFKGNILDLAEQAAREGFSPLIIAGGDGSIGDAVNGLARAAGTLETALGPLGIMPVGSANDLVHNLSIPLDLNEAAQAIAKGNTTTIDVCQLNERYFVNNSAIGLEPYVNTKQEKITWIKGIARYLVAAVQAIMDKKEWMAKIEWDDGSYEGLISLASVGNTALTGGVFFMTPHADPYDGKLTFVYGYRPTRLGMFQALPRTMKSDEGSYVEMDGIHEMDCTYVSIKLEQPCPAHTDGELLAEWGQEYEYKIYPKRLNVIVP